MKTILVTIDGSIQARKAMEFGADMACKYNSELVILHVLDQGDVPDELAHMAEVEHLVDAPPVDYLPPLAAVPHGEAVSRVNQQVHELIGEKLLKEAVKTARSKGVENIKKITQDGDPADQILKTAKVHNADVIVMGSRGLGPLKSMLVGSVSKKVNYLAKCTCVCVK